ncbi:hypothetical protein LXL04_037734 [Taraxacum kok-saghyz]
MDALPMRNSIIPRSRVWLERVRDTYRMPSLKSSQRFDNSDGWRLESVRKVNRLVVVEAWIQALDICFNFEPIFGLGFQGEQKDRSWTGPEKRLRPDRSITRLDRKKTGPKKDWTEEIPAKIV